MTPAEAILVAGQCDLSSFSDILLLLYRPVAKGGAMGAEAPPEMDFGGG